VTLVIRFPGNVGRRDRICAGFHHGGKRGQRRGDQPAGFRGSDKTGRGTHPWPFVAGFSAVRRGPVPVLSDPLTETSETARTGQENRFNGVRPRYAVQARGRNEIPVATVARRWETGCQRSGDGGQAHVHRLATVATRHFQRRATVATLT